MVSEVLEQVRRINEINQERVEIAAAEFSRKLVDLANGIPMKREPNALREYHHADGKVTRVPVCM